MWHMVGGEHYLKSLTPQLLGFGMNNVLKILNKRIANSMNESVKGHPPSSDLRYGEDDSISPSTLFFAAIKG